MTPDDITRMAREAGFVGLVDHPSLARFAALVAALAQEQAEPVAWMREGWGPDCGPYVEFYRSDEMGWRDRNGWAPLFTHPPRGEWQGLTEEEIDAALPHEPGDLDFVCARAIEAALKEKNA